jgi:hypothetical protein
MAKTVYATMLQKRATYEWFQTNKPILAPGQIGIVSTGQYKNCYKIGDGQSRWDQLSWVTDYNILFNRPSINGKEISGNKSLNDLGIASSQSLAEEKQQRQQADTAFQTNLNAEAAARKNADEVFQTSLNAEAAARKNADEEFQASLAEEAAARTSADEEFQASLAEETQNRQQADSAHAEMTNAHDATCTPASNRIAMYDGDKGLHSDKVPSADNDVARKIELDNMRTTMLGIVRGHRLISERAPMDPMILITEREGIQLKTERAII